MRVARCTVDLDADAWRAGRLRERVAAQRAERPRADRVLSDVAGLQHRLDVPVEPVGLARVAHVEHVAPLGAGRIRIARVVARVARPVRGQIARPRAGALDAHAVESQVAVRHVVERGRIAILHRARHVADQPPFADFVIGPQSVVRLPHVRAVAHRHEALQVERHLLPADPRLERARPQLIDVRDERLLEVELILVDGADRVLAERPRIDELHERLEVPAIAQVRVHVRALDHVIVVVRGAEAEQRRVVQFEALAQVRAERQVGRRIVAEPYVFQRVERLARHARIREHRPVLLPAVEQHRRAFRGARRRGGSRRRGRAARRLGIGADGRTRMQRGAARQHDARQRAAPRSLHRPAHRHFDRAWISAT